MANSIDITFDGRVVSVPTGTTVAAALLNLRASSFRQSITGEPRGPLCGMGVCHECRVTINGMPNQRCCQLPVAPGLRIETSPQRAGGAEDPVAYVPANIARISTSILILGAGPGGIAAACCAAESKANVVLVDDNPNPGGQIWRGSSSHSKDEAIQSWQNRLTASGAKILSQATAISMQSGNVLRIEQPNGATDVQFEKLILATGARELFLPFPGWTLPGVVGAGGLQALVKSGMQVKGKKIIVAGSGPLLLAVAALMNRSGADVPLVVEQASFSAVSGMMLELFKNRSKLREAMNLMADLAGTRKLYGSFPVSVSRNERGLRVRLQSNGKIIEEQCDILATSFGLIPNTDWAEMLHCKLDPEHFVVVDELQQTSQADIYAVGEITGIGGVEKAIVEGSIAGFAAAGQIDRATLVVPQLRAARRFVRLLKTCYALRSDLRQICTAATTVCRCEDVAFCELVNRRNARDAKLQTRIGMGPCQGRVCAPAVEFLLGWGERSVRPPVGVCAARSLV